MSGAEEDGPAAEFASASVITRVRYATVISDGVGACAGRGRLREAGWGRDFESSDGTALGEDDDEGSLIAAVPDMCATT